MSAPKLRFPVLIVLAGLSAGFISVWADIPRPAIVALVGLGVVCLIAMLRVEQGTQSAVSLLATAWGCSFILAPGVVFPGGSVFTLAPVLAVVAWLMAAMVLPPACFCLRGRVRSGWKLLCLAWGWFGVLIWLGSSYLHNELAPFLGALLLSLTLLIVSKRWFRMPALAVQSVNTLILLLVGLPIVDFLIWPPVDLDKPEPSQHLYLYRTARHDPAGFREWCAEYDVQLKALFKNLFKVDPTRELPYIARRGSHDTFFHSRISINDRGFRGPNAPPKKGRTYRIVALGESTTFGLTLNPEDTTWPALLQEMIRERLKPSRPVEVINAGTPGFSIAENLRRLKRDILPLKPDMIISYHGYNGFRLVQPALPRVRSTGPPPYRDRPLRILADCEYRLRLILEEHQEAADLYRHPVRLSDPLHNQYAKDYLTLIQIARTNHIRLALANYCMAVNSNSDLNVIQFYRKRFPLVFRQIRANEVHSAIVRSLGEEYPDIAFVDTHPSLDGKHDKFIDLVHFTQAGRRQLAENIFAGITNLLEEDLSARSVASR